MVRILVMVVVDPLPRLRRQRRFPHPAAVQDEAVEAVPDERIDRTTNPAATTARSSVGGDHSATPAVIAASDEIGEDRVILEVRDDELPQVHLVEIV